MGCDIHAVFQKKTPQVWKTGVMAIAKFYEWDGVGEPGSYCGGVSGGGIRIAASPVHVDEHSTHVRVYWRMSVDEFKYFTDEVKRLCDLHGEVRMVFGFDS